MCIWVEKEEEEEEEEDESPIQRFNIIYSYPPNPPTHPPTHLLTSRLERASRRSCAFSEG